jgi:hypothetical protein
MRPAVALVIPLLAIAAACTSFLGDFTLLEAPEEAGAHDSGFEPDSATPDAPSATVHAVASTPPSVFVGQSVAFDASNSTTTQGTLAFAWTLSSVPSGSQLSITSLASPSSPTCSLVPDAPGDYTLTVTVSALGASDSQQVTVTAFAPQVMFAGGAIGDGGADASATLDYYVATLGADAGTLQPVICSDAATPAALARLGAYASRAFDTWEGPAGTPSRFAAFTLEAASDGGNYAHLWAGTFDGSCPPANDFGTMNFGPNAPYGSEPRFSPDGGRFAVFDSNWNIVTYSFDGTGETNVVAPYGVPYQDAGAVLDPVDELSESGYILEPPRVSWTPSGGIVWARPLDDTQWEVVAADDSPSAAVTTYMTCQGVAPPREIAMLADNSGVIASYRDPSQGPGEDIIRLTRAAVGNQCLHDQYTDGPSATAVATDFALSPDGTQLAFLWRDPSIGDGTPWPLGFPGGFVFVMTISRRSLAVQISGDRALYGPRWIAGGAGLAFTRLDGVAVSTGDVETSVVVMSPDGGAEHVVAQGDGVTSFVSTSGNAACSLSPRAGSRPAWALSLVLVGAARRFRRRRSQSSPDASPQGGSRGAAKRPFRRSQR